MYLLLTALTSSALGGSSGLEQGDHIAMGGAVLASQPTGTPIVTADLGYEYMIAGRLGVGGTFQLITSGAGLGVSFGPRATVWAGDGDIAPFVGASVEYFDGQSYTSIGVGAHGGVALWLSDGAALTVGGDASYLLADSAVVWSFPIGLMARIGD